MLKKIFLCSISNINSGTCSEDCKFCSQSVKYRADIERYAKKPIKEILKEAKKFDSLGALGFCLVSAHKALDEKTLEFVCEISHTLKKEVPRLRLIACNGTASKEQLIELKNSGISAYNHNLETSQSFYAQICSTHPWSERYETCENVNSSGLNLICGGIFGMGESDKDRVSMLESIKSLKPVSVPLNFYHHNEALPLNPSTLSVDEALDIIRLSRKILSDVDRLMVAGGREITFKNRQDEIFSAGVNSIVIGNYLTTLGRNAYDDLDMIKKLGFDIATDTRVK